jgi:hypothetical protein
VTYVGTMVEATQARICTARDAARKFLEQARTARLAGDRKSWDWCMVRASQWRAQFCGLIQQGEKA